jgi:hypothetical protein
MSASEILERINQEHSADWDSAAMLALACQYIDYQQSDEAFEDFILNQAPSPICPTCRYRHGSGVTCEADARSDGRCPGCFRSLELCDCKKLTKGAAR